MAPACSEPSFDTESDTEVLFPPVVLYLTLLLQHSARSKKVEARSVSTQAFLNKSASSRESGRSTPLHATVTEEPNGKRTGESELTNGDFHEFRRRCCCCCIRSPCQQDATIDEGFNALI